MESEIAPWTTQDAFAQGYVRGFLSLREAVVLAEVSEKRVRKDIETGLLAKRIVRFGDARICFNWNYVVVLAAVYGSRLLSGGLRKIALNRVDSSMSGLQACRRASEENNVTRLYTCASDDHETDVQFRTWKVHIDNCVYLDLSAVNEKVGPRVGLYAEGLKRIEEKDDVLGGNAVFKDTRLSVCHVGKMYERGEPLANILADYPYLTPNDVEFAKIYNRAHPPKGRPRTPRAEEENGDASSIVVG